MPVPIGDSAACARCAASAWCRFCADIGHLGPLPTPGVVPDVEIKIPPHPILAREVARYVGDSVAFIVADTLAAAKDAAEAIEIDWHPLPHVTGAIDALKKGAPQVWPDRRGNLAFEVAVGLALIVALYRKHQTAHVEDLTTMKL